MVLNLQLNLLKETRVIKVRKVIKETKVILVNVDLKVSKVILDIKDLEVRLDRKVKRAPHLPMMILHLNNLSY
jgi:hypothetical protein